VPVSVSGSFQYSVSVARGNIGGQGGAVSPGSDGASPYPAPAPYLSAS
jgi:hypothetical protein